MASVDFPLCIYCDSDDSWILSHENGEVDYHCTNCGNTITVGVSDGQGLLSDAGN
jgi:predicted RNA-binding Zn-ribbon protein involved in translation (DUF1610 family)